ncbi:unnamed protein product [Durusdinium trenchii]|uniref:Uncharacterized protein n=1 Tax=Durusdinium trenchii TaxID=1381693 RepID=A0ABP0RYQ3_9DINO
MPEVAAELLSKELIERDKDWGDHNGYTALSEAAMAGHTVVVGQLLRADADPNLQAADGRSALHRAAFHGWIPIVRLLLQHGADPELGDVDGRRPMEMTKKESVLEVLGAGAEEHKEIIEQKRKERAENPREPKKESVEIQYPPKRNGPVTRRLVPEKNGSDQVKPEEKDEKFLELHSSLDIVTRPDDFANGRGDRAGYREEPGVRLQQGSLIVETSDGLFASDEVDQKSGPSPEEQAEAWLQDVGDLFVAPNLEAVMKAKSEDTDTALRQNPSNFKASFRRAKALFELGDLEQAMADVTKVVDHYARNTQVSNPEAVALRAAIQLELKKERAKWGEKGGPRWNRAAKECEPLISEVGPEYAA